jgi:AcrR family transcriptional regulator
MLASVAERGYAGTTVPRVVAEARVSRNAFYELYADKTDCFLDLCDQLADEVFADISAPAETEWRAALRAGTKRYLQWWREHRDVARTYFVELPSAGARALEQRDRQYARFRELFGALGAWARTQEPELPPLRPLASRAIVLAVTELVAEEVRAGRIDSLTELSGEISELIVALLTAPV